MKTFFTEKDLAFKSADPDELLEMGLEYQGSVSGLRNELSKMISRSKKEGNQKGQKSSFIAGFDHARKEYFLMIKELYEPHYLLSMLFELISETAVGDNIEEEIAIRIEQINSYLTEIAKNEEVNLDEEQSKLIQLTGQYLKTLQLYDEDDGLSDEELERLSDHFDSTFYDPFSKIIEAVLSKIQSGNMSIPVDMGDFPLPDED